MQLKKSYTLVEMIIVVMFVGILSAIAVPRLRFSAVYKYRAESTARKITTDLRRVRNLSITNAAGNSMGYALSMVGSSPYSACTIRNLNTSEVMETQVFDGGITVTGGDSFSFGPFGNLTGEDNELTVSAEGRSFDVSVITGTGMIKCVQTHK